MIHLKSKDTHHRDIRLAILVEPDLEGKVHNDTELYAAIRERGFARIVPCDYSKPDMPYGMAQQLLPGTFEEQWKGD